MGTLVLIGLAVLAAGIYLRCRVDRHLVSFDAALAHPLAHTADGQPVYPVVGYTPDGRPVTADRAIGYQPVSPKTNTLAIVTLIVSLVFSVAAIPLGHVALDQIKRTGEQGRGLALAGLIIGYVSLAGLILVGVVLAVSMN